VGSATTQYVFGGITNGVGYTFRVAAINAIGTGPMSVPSPVKIPLASSQVVAGGSHSCALWIDSLIVKCWGRNNAGQVGDGTLIDRKTPATVNGIGGTIAELAAGTNHTCARLTSGVVRCWGLNASGQLGDNTLTNRSAPVQVVGLSGVTAIAAGGSHTCARLATGVVKCWGLNTSGQLGDNTVVNKKLPVQVVGLTGASGVVAGGNHTIARLTATGGLRAFGLNTTGQLGDNTLLNRKTPVSVFGFS
jgi:alpha-tubulin suppressor-like RCC1 family protein